MSRQAKELSARSYIATAPFNANFFTYKTSKNSVTFKTTGDLSVVTGANSGNCPAGRILRENGRKLFPPAHPIDTVNGVAVTFPPTVMVGVFDNQSGLSGFIDPNAPMYAVYSGDRPNYLKDSVDPVGGLTDRSAPTLTNGSVNVRQNLDVMGNSDLTGTLRVTGATTLDGNATINARLIMNSGNTGVADMSTGIDDGVHRKTTVTAANCRTTSRILLTYSGLNNAGILSAENIANGSFKIVSTSRTDGGTVMYFIFN
jgi:hypothetical protein